MAMLKSLICVFAIVHAALSIDECVWNEQVTLSENTYQNFQCESIATNTVAGFTVSSLSGLDDFNVLLLSNYNYDRWLEGEEPLCANECSAMDSTQKEGGFYVLADHAPWHFVIVNGARNAAAFHAVVNFTTIHDEL
eukprot:TRINITY_DN4494_c0_g1_i1.p1 TRINITY_DN4494_c0_g1~~TRINITY_DN4494_c0_g1_i1.p1  ORF type:complete len:137 (-),score=31.54 TRINITY_DN4494_c0_g1_i1:191-601(-)